MCIVLGVSKKYNMLDMRAVILYLASEVCLLLSRNAMLCVTFGVADLSLSLCASSEAVRCFYRYPASQDSDSSQEGVDNSSSIAAGLCQCELYLPRC